MTAQKRKPSSKPNYPLNPLAGMNPNRAHAIMQLIRAFSPDEDDDYIVCLAEVVARRRELRGSCNGLAILCEHKEAQGQLSAPVAIG